MKDKPDLWIKLLLGLLSAVIGLFCWLLVETKKDLRHEMQVLAGQVQIIYQHSLAGDD